MTTFKSKPISIWICLFAGALLLSAGFLIFLGCSTTQTVVEKTTKTVKRTTRDITRNIVLSDGDLNRKVGIFNFENNTLQKSRNFQEIFHKGLPEYLSESMSGNYCDNFRPPVDF